MLTSTEQKLVVDTLAKRCSWLKKTVDEGSLDEQIAASYRAQLMALESAAKKIANSAPSASVKTQPTAPLKAVPKKEGRATDIANASILVAEDNDDSAKLMLDVLEDFGAKDVVLAKDGVEAFDAIKKSEDGFDVILCDWDMPGLSGLEVHNRALSSNTLRGAHFMMVTAVSESKRIREAIQQGVDDYIVKPIDIDTLESKIQTALGQNNQQSP